MIGVISTFFKTVPSSCDEEEKSKDEQLTSRTSQRQGGQKKTKAETSKQVFLC